jgi:hypothetical protein
MCYDKLSLLYFSIHELKNSRLYHLKAARSLTEPQDSPLRKHAEEQINKREELKAKQSEI